MEINYIILAHKNPSQVARLIDRLNAEGNHFYVHVDRHCAIEEFEQEVDKKDNIFFLQDQQRKAVVWGDFSMVEATLNALLQLEKDRRKGYCILLSGQDYPLKKNEFIKKYLSENNGTHFIDFFHFSNRWEENYLNRIEKYKINKSSNRKHFLLLSSIFDKDFYNYETIGKINYLRKTKKIKTVLNILKKRTFPKHINPVVGGQWWAFPMETVEKIIHFVKMNPEYLKYHFYTLCADEIFFHSIIGLFNDQENLKIKPSLTYVNWNRKSGSLPVTFQEEDLAEIENAATEKLFARKFDRSLDEKILDKIDHQIIKGLEF